MALNTRLLVRCSTSACDEKATAAHFYTDVLKKILSFGNIAVVTTIIEQISMASQEQTSGIEQINSAVSEMDQVTQQNAALVEEAAAASESMREQAARLTDIVGFFKLDEVSPAHRRHHAGHPIQHPARPAVPNKVAAARLSPTKAGTLLRNRMRPKVDAAAAEEYESF